MRQYNAYLAQSSNCYELSVGGKVYVSKQNIDSNVLI